MASSITLKIGTLTSTITFAKSDAEVATVLRRFIKRKADPAPDGLTQQQANQYALDQALAEIVRMVRQEATQVHAAELREAQGSIEQQAEAENAI